MFIADICSLLDFRDSFTSSISVSNPTKHSLASPRPDSPPLGRLRRPGLRGVGAAGGRRRGGCPGRGWSGTPRERCFLGEEGLRGLVSDEFLCGLGFELLCLFGTFFVLIVEVILLLEFDISEIWILMTLLVHVCPP